jgi:hypothetical protein|nr:MAG TPA: hypothetical protein [Caudoviricetes sp.]
MKRTFLKIIDESNHLEVGCVDGYMDISISSNEDVYNYLSVKITEDEIQELIDFLTEKRKELERIITERKG